MPELNPDSPAEKRPGMLRRDYVVLARRYRPQTFSELVGQEHVAQALSNAVATNRVGHAYLFTGARGVGKTSAARILAKALNCQEGPTPSPCNRCDICERISTGDDVDVLEIDGASNRGIDEIRQLRQTVNVRPSRERFKIYIIDEVHMLTREAFNALLKTLEEPPEHVKFIFCTTEPTKIPVTILSRCQRFDFAGIPTSAIVRRLEQIVRAEGVTAEPEALHLLARRAAGSMRDSQSLLDQLLAFAPQTITVADVHAMLGTAATDCLLRLVEHLSRGEPGPAIRELDSALQEGVDPGQLIEQLLGVYRDLMVASTGCPTEMLLHVSPELAPQIHDCAQRLGLENLLAAMQILDQTLNRLRYSTQGRLLAELALVQIASLGDLVELSELVSTLRSGGALPATYGAAPPASGSEQPNATESKKKPNAAAPEGSLLSPDSGAPDSGGAQRPAPSPLTTHSATDIWVQAASRVPGLIGEHAKHFCRATMVEPNRLVVSFRPEYTLSKSLVEAPAQKARFEQALAEVTGQPVRLDLEVIDSARGAGDDPSQAGVRNPLQRRAQVSQHPLVQRAVELFGAFPERIEAMPPGEPLA